MALKQALVHDPSTKATSLQKDAQESGFHLATHYGYLVPGVTYLTRLHLVLCRVVLLGLLGVMRYLPLALSKLLRRAGWGRCVLLRRHDEESGGCKMEGVRCCVVVGIEAPSPFVRGLWERTSLTLVLAIGTNRPGPSRRVQLQRPTLRGAHFASLVR